MVREEVRCRMRFALGPLNMIDAVAILPLYIELLLAACGQDTSIGFMRIIRWGAVCCGIAVECSAVQCVAVCCCLLVRKTQVSVLCELSGGVQCAAVYCGVLRFCSGVECVALCCSVLVGKTQVSVVAYYPVCCSVVQCVAVCGSVLQSIGGQYDSTAFCNCQFLTLQRTETHMDTLQHSVSICVSVRCSVRN